MRKVLIVLGVLMVLPGVLLGIHLLIIHSGGPVITLTSFDEMDEPHETRLWIVEHLGEIWVNAGSEDAEWLARVRARPDVVVLNGDEQLEMTAVPKPEEREVILTVMRRRYGWRDQYVRSLMGRESVPVRLDEN